MIILTLFRLSVTIKKERTTEQKCVKSYQINVHYTQLLFAFGSLLLIASIFIHLTFKNESYLLLWFVSTSWLIETFLLIKMISTFLYPGAKLSLNITPFSKVKNKPFNIFANIKNIRMLTAYSKKPKLIKTFWNFFKDYGDSINPVVFWITDWSQPFGNTLMPHITNNILSLSSKIEKLWEIIFLVRLQWKNSLKWLTFSNSYNKALLLKI